MLLSGRPFTLVQGDSRGSPGTVPSGLGRRAVPWFAPVPGSHKGHQVAEATTSTRAQSEATGHRLAHSSQAPRSHHPAGAPQARLEGALSTAGPQEVCTGSLPPVRTGQAIWEATGEAYCRAASGVTRPATRPASAQASSPACLPASWRACGQGTTAEAGAVAGFLAGQVTGAAGRRVASGAAGQRARRATLHTTWQAA